MGLKELLLLQQTKVLFGRWAAVLCASEKPGFESRHNVPAHGPRLRRELSGHRHSQCRPVQVILIHCSWDIRGWKQVLYDTPSISNNGIHFFYPHTLKVCVTNVNEEQNGAKSVMKYLSSSHLSFFISVPLRDSALSESGFVVPAISSILSLLVVPPQPPAMCCCQLRLPHRGRECPVLIPARS